MKRTASLKVDPEKAREFQRRAVTNSKPRSRSFTPASKEQREFCAGKFCLECGATPVDACHIIPRGRLSEGQEDVRAVMPLCRAHHRDLDEGRLDVLPLLEQDGWRPHLAFAVERYGLVGTLERITNERWAPVAAVTR